MSKTYNAKHLPVSIVKVRRDRLRSRLAKLQSTITRHRWRLERLDDQLRAAQ